MATFPQKPLLNDHTTASILAPDGTVAVKPTLLLSPEEAKLLREYKKFLQRHRFQEALICQDCSSLQTRLFVTDQQIGGACDCRMIFYSGPTI